MLVTETYTIGKVVKKLSATYPDLSVSKVRFLEAEGLVKPHRTKNGYRRFTEKDIERLETVLRLQSSCFYPLSVIKEKLEAYDRGEHVAELAGEEKKEEKSERFEGIDGLFTLDSSMERLGVPASFIRSLADNGLLTVLKDESGRPACYGTDAPLIAAAYDLKKYGIDPRILKLYVQRANREIPVFKAALSSLSSRLASLDEVQAKARFYAELDTLIELTSTVSEGIIRREVAAEFGYLPKKPE